MTITEFFDMVSELNGTLNRYGFIARVGLGVQFYGYAIGGDYGNTIRDFEEFKEKLIEYVRDRNGNIIDKNGEVVSSQELLNSISLQERVGLGYRVYVSDCCITNADTKLPQIQLYLGIIERYE
jgi:hypothetical protein